MQARRRHPNPFFLYTVTENSLSLPSYSRQQHPTPPRVLLLRVCNVVHGGGGGGDANADARAINLALE